MSDAGFSDRDETASAWGGEEETVALRSPEEGEREERLRLIASAQKGRSLPTSRWLLPLGLIVAAGVLGVVALRSGGDHQPASESATRSIDIAKVSRATQARKVESHRASHRDRRRDSQTERNHRKRDRDRGRSRQSIPQPSASPAEQAGAAPVAPAPVVAARPATAPRSSVPAPAPPPPSNSPANPTCQFSIECSGG